jgi:ATP-binding cassette, subfamily B, bacterial
MFGDIYNKKQRVRDFFADSAKGFLLIWNSGKQLTLINFGLFILQAIVPLLSLIVLKNLIDQVIKSGNQWEHTGMNLALFALLQLANVIISQVSAYQLSLQQQIISDNLAGEVLNKAISLDLQYYENPSFYDELHMAQQQSLNKPAQLIAAYQGIIQNLTTIVAFSGFMVMAHWSVLILIVVLGIPLAISKLLHGYQQYQLDKDCLPAQRKAADLFHYLTTDAYAKEVRIFNFGGSFISQFLHFKKYIFTRKKDLHYKFLKQNIFIQLFEISVTTIIYCIIIASAIAGAITIGTLVIYFTVFQRIQTAITNLFQSAITLLQHQLYLRQVLKYLATPPAIKDNYSQLPMPPLSEGIEVRHLDFTYPDTQRLVLKDINMVFKPGKITAIVGENGSGKSTLIKLLCRLYEAEHPAVFIDGTNVSEIAQDELRKNITAVFQDFGKYYLTIEDNVTLGSNKKDTTGLDKATTKAGLADKIHSFPAGYKTILGRTFKNGEQLSGGQWQKIALARMFYKDSNIVILDEPTSSMDPIAEHEIFKNLKENIGNKIIILITHRLYNLKLADHIYVMENGTVAESGTFNGLLSSKGTFANIYDKQII